MIRRAAALLVFLVSAGCGGGDEVLGTSQLCVSRDLGGEVVMNVITADGYSEHEEIEPEFEY